MILGIFGPVVTAKPTSADACLKPVVALLFIFKVTFLHNLWLICSYGLGEIPLETL